MVLGTGSLKKCYIRKAQRFDGSMNVPCGFGFITLTMSCYSIKFSFLFLSGFLMCVPLLCAAFCLVVTLQKVPQQMTLTSWPGMSQPPEL